MRFMMMPGVDMSGFLDNNILLYDFGTMRLKAAGLEDLDTPL
jgi:hypothetical protein